MIMNERIKTFDANVVDFKSAKMVKEFIETAGQRIYELEDSLYAIIDCHRLDIAKEIAADVLNENLDILLEEDTGVEELNFDDDTSGEMGLPWDEIET